eukprot:CAMPEP_0172180598 /NCGR_PEP_ID=MMETSP1050-20130122/17332_1 /TAXON_ID=233186 /ORGANISM="Cryptomonas curvata, Strain CCAP979/52" /LENGTH=76 /DNA_ID=CAMNT_0012853749 /DNA_START=64 /DNA_END=290 /DNA_ORIENTATION=-
MGRFRGAVRQSVSFLLPGGRGGWVGGWGLAPLESGAAPLVVAASGAAVRPAGKCAAGLEKRRLTGTGPPRGRSPSP